MQTGFGLNDTPEQRAKNRRVDIVVLAAEAGIQALEAFYAAIRMPLNLHEAGVKQEDLDGMQQRR